MNRSAWALRALAVSLATAAAGCEPQLTPDLVTPAGMHVYVEAGARSFGGDELDAVVAETVRVFASRWGLKAEEATRALPVVSILAADSYSFYGRQVAGNLGFDGKWLYIGARTRPLHDTALVHELVHYFDLLAQGATDHSHASWAGAVNDQVVQINQRIARGELGQR